MTSALDDRVLIHDLFVRYVCALDDGDVDTVVGCFTEDASLESPAVGSVSGRAAIRSFAERFAAFRQRGAQVRHVISNLRVEVAGDRARARCYLVVFITREGASELLPPGIYDCDLVRTDGEWRFQRRVVRHDHDYRIAGL